MTLYEDNDLLVVEKPAGTPTLPEKGGISPTLADLLIHDHPELAKLPDVGITHRLDNDTSGLVIVAKSFAIYDALRKVFHEGTIEKEYTALVLGHPNDEGTIDLPIAHHPRKTKKMIVCENPARAEELKGREAKTMYRVLKRFLRYPMTPYALLSLTMTAGVRHQLRIHLAHLGFPIAGDRLYQNITKQKQDLLPLKRHFLHASRISFAHPSTGKRLSFASELPPDLSEVLGQLVDRKGQVP